MSDVFAIWPMGEDRPAAFFRDLDDAQEWGRLKYGETRFSIRVEALTTSSSDPDCAGPGKKSPPD